MSAIDNNGTDAESTHPALTWNLDAVGNRTSTVLNGTTTPLTRYLFTGREFDATSGLYHYRHRWYHPGIGRFVQPDPIGFAGGDVNWYGYVDADPLSMFDPEGLSPKRYGWMPNDNIGGGGAGGARGGAGARAGSGRMAPPSTSGPGRRVASRPFEGKLESGRHHINSKGRVSPPPSNPSQALRDSMPVKEGQRISCDKSGEISVWRRSDPHAPGVGKWHGYKVPWEDLHREQQNCLINNGFFKTGGTFIPQP